MNHQVPFGYITHTHHIPMIPCPKATSAEWWRRASWVARCTCSSEGVALLPGASCGLGNVFCLGSQDVMMIVWLYGQNMYMMYTYIYICVCVSVCFMCILTIFLNVYYRYDKTIRISADWFIIVRDTTWFCWRIMLGPWEISNIDLKIVVVISSA